MNRNIFIVDIEPLDNRYTKQWHTHIPKLLKQKFPDYNIVTIPGDNTGYDKPSTGKFFDFGATCTYKSSQAHHISKLFTDNKVQSNDIFFFTDAWNQTIHTVKYISELNKIPVKTCGIWHAGYYDETDILGQSITNHDWAKHLEISMYNAYDLNFFGTRQHMNKFINKYDVDKIHAFTVGYPLEYLNELVPDYNNKKNIIVFPHRLNDDKAPEVFRYIRDYMKQFVDYQFIMTQEHNYTKDEYYELIKSAKIVFSANKHENLGIGTFECMMLGCVPVVPDKLSYHEMYPIHYRYMIDDSMYTDMTKWHELGHKMKNMVQSYSKNTYDTVLSDSKRIYERYFTSELMLHLLGRL
jgi:glycosyltransferase involved in cell wall biosynthesis